MRAEEALALILRDTERSCGRSLLLSLFIASSIQQGGASEPGVQPGQAGGGGALQSREGRGIGRDGGVVEDGARVCLCGHVCGSDDAAAVEGASARWDRARVCAFLSF